MKVTVIGTGYLGLVTGACLADVGNDVVCLDTDAREIEMLDSGEIPIFEPGLKDLVRSNKDAGRLAFTTDAERAVRHGGIQFIAVGTPSDKDGSADLQYVIAAARSIAQHMAEYCVVVDRSTVPVGTRDLVQQEMAEELARRGVDTTFSVVSNPEFLKEGAAIADFMRPDRIIVGADDERALEQLRELYAPFERNHVKLMVMDVRSAELAKYAANAMLATRISFMNELALLAERVGADIDQVRRGIGADPRIGSHFLYAGCGYGGSCFPKDVHALVRTGEANGVEMGVVRSVAAANEAQKRVLVDKVVRRLGSDLTNRRIALWGLSFKPDTDDMRAAPSLVIIDELLARNATVVAYDPVAMPMAARVIGQRDRFEFAPRAMQAAEGADALVLVTEWKEFRSPDLRRLRDTLKQPLIFDGRNILDPAHVRAAGLEYSGIGTR